MRASAAERVELDSQSDACGHFVGDWLQTDQPVVISEMWREGVISSFPSWQRTLAIVSRTYDGVLIDWGLVSHSF